MLFSLLFYRTVSTWCLCVLSSSELPLPSTSQTCHAAWIAPCLRATRLEFPTAQVEWDLSCVDCRWWGGGGGGGGGENVALVGQKEAGYLSRTIRQNESRLLLVRAPSIENSRCNPPACRRVWLEGVVPVSVLGLYLFLCSLATRFCFVWIVSTPPPSRTRTMLLCY